MTRDLHRRVDVAEAEALIAGEVRGWGKVRVAIDDAGGEVLHEPIVAERDQPPFDRVTMDGVAVAHAALERGVGTFTVAGTRGAGGNSIDLPDDTTCIAVMTGAALPGGADTILPVERIVRTGERVQIETGYRATRGQFIHARGSDHGAGAVLLAPGCRIGPPEMAVLTLGGSATVAIARRPSIAVISTGDELVDVGAPVGAHQIRMSNDRAIVAALAARGFRRCVRRHLPDDRAVLERELAALLAGHDVLVLTGGVSMGEFDYVPQVLTALGVEVVFHKILQRPGLPMWFGVSPDGKPVFALPGNPVSSLVCLVRYALPALDAALGASLPPTEFVPLAEAVRFEPDLSYFLPVQVRSAANGHRAAYPRPTNTSGDFVALAGTDGFIELPRGTSAFQRGYFARFHAW